MRALAFKAIAASALAIVAATSIASAADMAPRYTKAPLMVEVWNWTGFYVGGNAGHSWGRGNSDVSYVNTATGLPIAPPVGFITGVGFDMNGAIAGGQIGYNWQSNNWVFGLEADAQWSDEKGRGGFNCAATLAGGQCLPGLTFLPAGVTGTSLTIDQHLEWFGTVRGRVGILATPKILFYGTGGLAYGSFKTTGAMVGATPAGVWSLRSARAAMSALAGRSAPALKARSPATGAPSSNTSTWISTASGPEAFRWHRPAPSTEMSTSFHDHVLRVGLNYSFGGR